MYINVVEFEKFYFVDKDHFKINWLGFTKNYCCYAVYSIHAMHTV